MGFQQINAPVNGVVPDKDYAYWIEGQTGDGWYGWWIGSGLLVVGLVGFLLLAVFHHIGWLIPSAVFLTAILFIVPPGIKRIRAMKQNRYVIVFDRNNVSNTTHNQHLDKACWCRDLRALRETRRTLLQLAALPGTGEQLNRAANEIAIVRWQIAKMYLTLEPFIERRDSQPTVVDKAIATRYKQLEEANRDAKELLSMGTELAFRTVQLGPNDRHLEIFHREFDTQVQAMRELAEITEAAWAAVTPEK